MSIFKTYDIRGAYPNDLNEALAYKIARAFAQLLSGESKRPDKLQLVIARDMRLSGPQLAKEAIRGLREGGADVVDIGLASTPTFYFAVAMYQYDGGMMVSASHNPKEYNGFKMVRQKSIPVSGEKGIKDIERAVGLGNFEPVEFEGHYSERKGVLEDHVAHDIGYADLKSIKPFKIVADAANAMGAQYLDALFAKLPCKLVRMNFDLDGTFPVHEADPFKEENIVDLKKRVIAEGADLGIATDGDGDRIFFIDNEGQLIDPAIVRGIMARVFLRKRPGAKIAYDIRPGRITRDMIIEDGGIPVVTRVGHSLIKETMLWERAYFAGESSGHFFLNMQHGGYEVPMIVALKMLQEFSRSGKTSAEYVRPLRKYFHSGEINSSVRDVAEVISAVSKKYSDGKQDMLDGVTVEYSDYWFNVRGSNTEPVIRLNLEAKEKELMGTKRDEILGLIKSFATG